MSQLKELFVNHGHLAQLSPYFQALFFGSGQNSTKTHIRIKEVGPQTQNHSQNFWLQCSGCIEVTSQVLRHTELKLRCFTKAPLYSNTANCN